MNSECLHLLIVDDEELRIKTIQQAFARVHSKIHLQTVPNLQKYRNAVAIRVPDFVLMNFKLSDGSALDVLKGPPENTPFPILVMMSDSKQEKEGIEAYDHVIQSPATLASLPHTVNQIFYQWNLRQSNQCLELERQNTSRFQLMYETQEQKLRQLSRIVEKSLNLVIITNPEGIIEYVNQRFTTVTGYSPEEVIGKSTNFLKSGETPPETYKILWETIIAGNEWRGEFHTRKKNGELYWERVSISPITDKIGVITHFLALKEDITEYKLLTEQFLRAQRIENIGRLASGVAHDINNILAPIMLASTMLDEELPADTHRQLVLTIQESAKRGADIVRQVLTFARGVEGQKTLLQPQLVLAQMENILRETFPKSIDCTLSVPEGLWTVFGDATQLHQVLLNLCVNARDAMMPGGGSLVMSAENIEIDENYAATTHNAKPGRYVVMKVTDSGCGIPNSMIGTIFDPFFTTKETGKGTGLGLSTVVGIVKSHNGFIEVDSEPESGSTFRVFIPTTGTFVPNPIESTLEFGPEESPLPPQGNGETILIVDDEPAILKVTTSLLSKNGYTVLTAGDGIEALTIYVKNSAEITLIVTDVMMPMMDGVNLTRALKKINPSVQVIAASGHTETSHKNDLRALGIQTFLIKPFNNYQLLEAIHNTITSA